MPEALKTAAAVLLVVIAAALLLVMLGPAIGTVELIIGLILLLAVGYGIYRWRRRRTA